ncbi:NTP transferase domain-containing protein [Francisellaceae bacterium]|nr:NTP transferase domain-containing protein [Francisellaceae bacterium]
MKAMILAAGRGKRMEHLTDKCPKPLIQVKGKTLLEYQIERLVQAGVTEIIINVAYLAEKNC